jgi:hypothetical protein
MTEIKAGGLYYESGSWPARHVKVIRVAHNTLVSAPDGSQARYLSSSFLHPTRLDADEATLLILKLQLANFEERARQLREEVAELESKKGQA